MRKRKLKYHANLIYYQGHSGKPGSYTHYFRGYRNSYTERDYLPVFMFRDSVVVVGGALEGLLIARKLYRSNDGGHSIIGVSRPGQIKCYHFDSTIVDEPDWESVSVLELGELKVKEHRLKERGVAQK